MNSPENNMNDGIITQWPRDGVRAWLVCAASFYLYAIAWGTPGALPMLLPHLVKLFNNTSAGKQGSSNNDYSFNLVVTTNPHFFQLQKNSPSSNGLFYRTSSVPFPITTPNPADDKYIHSKVQLIWSLNNAVIYFICVLAPFIYNRVGCRLTMLLGILLFIVGALLPALFPRESLWIWWLSFGVANGAGSAIMYVTSCLVIEQSFERHFGLASGLQSIGSGVSFVLFPLLWQRLLDLGPSFSHTSSDSPKAIAAGLSLSLYSVALCAAALIPMLPLFGSPFFMAQRTALLRKQLRASSAFSGGDSVNSETSIAPLNPASSRSIATSSSVNSSCVYDPPPRTFARVIYFLFDIPVRRGRKYSPTSSHNSQSNESSQNSLWSELAVYFRLIFHRNFFLYLISGQLFQFVTCVPDSFSVMQASELFPERAASAGLTLTFYGVAQSIGKLVVSPLSDVFPSLFGRTMLSTTGVVVKGLATSFAPIALVLVCRLETIWTLNAVYGFWDGLQYGVYSALTLSLLGSERFGAGIALSQFLCAIPTMFGAPLAGLVLDLFHDYCTFYML